MTGDQIDSMTNSLKETQARLKLAEDKNHKLEEQFKRIEDNRRKEAGYLNAVEEAVKINEEMICKLAKRLGPEEQINFQIDIIKVELRTSLQ